MNENGLALSYDEESRTWGIKKESYATIEVETEEDFAFLQEAVKLAKGLVRCNECLKLNRETGECSVFTGHYPARDWFCNFGKRSDQDGSTESPT